MLITKSVSNFIIFENQTIREALLKIDHNQRRIVFVVNEVGVLVGSLSDGDFRRWVTKKVDSSLDAKVLEVLNTQVISKSIDFPINKLELIFNERIEIIPLVDGQNKVVAIASSKDAGLEIGDKLINEKSPAYIIAEIGNNHNGDINLAKQLVDIARQAGADCVKFQMRDMSTLYKYDAQSKNQDEADLGTQYVLDLLDKFQLKNDELISVFDYCKQQNIQPLCTPWDENSLKLLEDYGMQAYKVASADLTNHFFLEKLAATSKPLICSTGMSTEQEIKNSANFLKRYAPQFILLHCNSTYPTPFKDVNLSYLDRLRKMGNGLVGYSGHERGYHVAVAAVALGAKVVEKHLTIDKTMEGNDHKVSLLADEFKSMVDAIRAIESAMGSTADRVLTQGELVNRETLAKSLVSTGEIKVGEIISRDMIAIKSPGQGLQPCYIDQLVGRVAKHDFNKDDYFHESDLSDVVIVAKKYHFTRPFGVPVRFHDYKKLSQMSNFDFVEFHLSYQDMNVDLQTIFDSKQSIGFAVHSPELFANDHILDLASQDKKYRQQSITALQDVIDLTRSLKHYFPKTKSPVIVTNVGGFSTANFLEKDQRSRLYQQVADSLNELKCDGVEVIIQNMPPFPWHFGGQSHHNIFIDPHEIVRFCKNNNYRICFDVSHAMMACNYFGWTLADFTKLVGPYTAHLHIVDALGIDGEGIQIGKGDVDFRKLSSLLNKLAPSIQFIPEIWQGHKNDGAGFWQGLEFLETALN